MADLSSIYLSLTLRNPLVVSDSPLDDRAVGGILQRGGRFSAPGGFSPSAIQPSKRRSSRSCARRVSRG